MLIYDDIIFKKLLLLFRKLLSYLVCVSSFKSINSSSLSGKKFDGDDFIPTSLKRLRVQSMSVVIRLIELTEPSDTLNYKPFFKYWILQTILHIFLLVILVWSKVFCSKSWAVFFIFLIWFGLALIQY